MPSSERPLAAAALEERLEELIGAVLSSQRTAAGIAQALAAEPRALQEFALRWVAVTAKSSPELAYQFAALAPRAVAELGATGAERWLLAAMDVYDREGLYRASAALQDLAACAARLRAHWRGLAFEEAARVLAPFLAGLSGRRLRLEAAETAWTDTATIYLPAQVALFDARADNFRVYKLAAALLWAQARFGTFNLDAAAYPRAPRERALFAFLEMMRLAARLEHSLPGLYRDYLALAQPAPDAEFDGARARLRAPGAGAADSLAFCKRLVRETGLGLAPGAAFGPEGEGFVRWCFAAAEARLADGVQRLRRMLG